LTQLRELELDMMGDITAKQVVSLLTPLKQLTSLALHYTICREAFDALLRHAPQLTSFTCTDLAYLDQDRSASPCSWKELVFTDSTLEASALAYLPTASLTLLEFGNMVFPSSYPTLRFNIYTPGFVRRSLQNLVQCPAWQQCGPKVDVKLFPDLGDDAPKQLGPLLSALAPLAGKEVKLAIWVPNAVIGASAVQQLGTALESSLKQLWLQSCEVTHDFWPAVWAHLPGLQQLTIGEEICGAFGTEEVESFCSHATRPLQLRLARELDYFWYLWKEGQADRECLLGAVPLVTVSSVKTTSIAPE
jgi:hypothetical protein